MSCPVHGKKLVKDLAASSEGSIPVMGHHLGNCSEPHFPECIHLGQGQVHRAVLWYVWVLTAAPYLYHVALSFVVLKTHLERKAGVPHH